MTNCKYFFVWTHYSSSYYFQIQLSHNTQKATVIQCGNTTFDHMGACRSVVLIKQLLTILY